MIEETMIRKAITDLVDFSDFPEGMEVRISNLEYSGDFIVKSTKEEGRRYEGLMFVKGSTFGAIDIEIDVYNNGDVEAKLPNDDVSLFDI